MQANASSYKRWIAPIAIALGLALVLFLSNRPLTGPDGLPIITDAESYSTALKKAESLSRVAFEKADHGEELNDEDRANLRLAAKLFDSMNRFEPTRLGPYIGAGKAYQLTGDTESSDVRLQQCISNAQLDSSQSAKDTAVEAKYLLSMVKGLQNDWTTAYQLADEAVKSHPDSANYLAARASAEIQLQKLDAAKADVAMALKLDPTQKMALRIQKLLQSTK